MTPIRRAAFGPLLLGPLLGACLLIAGCTPGPGLAGERAVFAVASGFGQGIRATTVDVVDMGVPDLRNLTGKSVRLGAVTLVSVPKAVHVRSVTAYSYSQTGGLGMGLGHGDLLRSCRKYYRPYPLTDAVTPRYANSDWFVVIAFTITRPGRYYLGRVKISYTTGGQPGWQYQNLFTTITVTAARPGTTPRFDGCP